MTLRTGGEADEDIVSKTSSLSSIKGGILSDSMGLGKSVEVLACILANSRPKEQWLESPNIPAKKRLTFEDAGGPSLSLKLLKEDLPVGVRVVNDISEFGGAEESTGEEGCESSAHSVEHPRAASTSRTAVPVTPDREALDEVWVDEDVIGSCICGKLIGFSHRKCLGPVVLCESCNEPMHKDCAGFLSRTELQSCTTPLRYRQRYSNLSLDCVVCDKSICPSCVAGSSRKLTSRATLIITPPAILNQWEREIARHTRTSNEGPLKTLVYMGLEPACKAPATSKAETVKLLHPRHLSDADIVLTTFDALMGDLAHSDENRFVPSSGQEDSGGYLRNRKKYRAVPSPLLSINWWRVCLDEAQRVETPTAASARMALKLSAEHRWCVTGTPIGRGKLEDLFGLLLFLRSNPFSSKAWFSKCFSPSNGMVDFQISHLLSHLFWRSTPSHPIVMKQMGVPEQAERKIVLSASSVERHFYERLVRVTSRGATRELSR
jgi:E3 ubiquitin-protein ligase SHPRH